MNTARVEALKEIARWLAFFVISWIIGETLKQVNLVPELMKIKLWVFVYSIPVRSLFTLALTMAGRYTDKYLHLVNKEKGYTPVNGNAPSMGILPW